MTEKIMIGYADAAAGTNEIREATDEEKNELLEAQKLILEENLKRAEQETSKAAARQALLDKLGLTEEEAKLLLS